MGLILSKPFCPDIIIDGQYDIDDLYEIEAHEEVLNGICFHCEKGINTLKVVYYCFDHPHCSEKCANQTSAYLEKFQSHIEIQEETSRISPIPMENHFNLVKFDALELPCSGTSGN